ncbi:MAG: porin [Prolixibacteraceae bacterium]|jgi:hypothetical protein|nr:porin [Prolixibacteraceae bacterium]
MKLQKLLFSSFFTILFLLPFVRVAGQDEPLAEQIKDKIQHEAFTVNSILQTGFRYSLADDGFQGGRTFELGNARISLRGSIDNGFYYRLFLNFAGEPNLLDAYIGYRLNDGLRFTLGAMKPKQSLDFIPSPASTDFIDRTRIAGLLVQSRELGLSAEGDLGGFYYFAGLFNGNKHRLNNNNNKFYTIGRAQYTFREIIPGYLQFAVQGSYGDTPGVQTGNAGPILSGARTIMGTDFRLETNNYILAAEYLTGDLEIEKNDAEQTETISGYYITGGYSISDKTMILGRWQNWNHKLDNTDDNQLTIGVNQGITSIASMQFNFDSYYPHIGETQYGLSFLLQIAF